jgi:ubiquinone biosynthesis protein
VRVLRWPGTFLRALFVLLVGIICLVIYLLGRIYTLFIFNRERRASAVAKLRGKLLRHSMTTLGATFIKMGQVMSTRPDLFPPEIIAELRILQDRLPAFGYWRARRIVEKDLGAPIDQVFSEFDKKPVAAASVAQVHRARLQDCGDEVAVKVLRPNIRRQVERDGGILLGFARVFAIHPRVRLSDPVGHLRHFVQAIVDQTDLTIEADNNRRFAANFESAPKIHFPPLYDDYCTKRVITMQFERGSKVDALGEGSHLDIAELTRHTVLKMCFEDGFVHADLHPGNMLVREDRELVIFDLGIAKQLEDDVLLQFIDMSKCLSMGTPEDLVSHLRRFHTYLDDVDWESLRKDVDAFAARFRKQDTSELEYGELIGEMFAIGRSYRVRPVTDMTLIFVTLVTAQGVGKMLNPNGKIFDEVAMFLLPILASRGESIPDTDEARAARDGRAEAN